MLTAANHTFAVCAYKHSPFLSDCLESLVSQTLSANILVATSTPCENTEQLCRHYGVPLYVNEAAPGIARDWNYAMSVANTDLVTIAHQDDTYCPSYLEKLLESINRANDPLLYFTNYGEIRNGDCVNNNQLLRIKRLMLSPLKVRSLQSSVFVRRLILSFGSPICCPSVTYVKSKFDEPLFRDDYEAALDWQTWELLSRKSGSYIYNPEILMHHRIHEESETSRLIKDDKRFLEDQEMLEKFWPKPIASFVNSFYSKGQTSNDS